jgi:serine/threonine protein kinase
VLNIITQLVSGLDHIHSQGCCHRDLKPENILRLYPGIYIIFDFGTSKIVEGFDDQTFEASSGAIC